MSDKVLRSKLIRLAHTNPNLRSVLLPLLKTAAFDAGLAEDLRQLCILVSRNAKTALRALLSNGSDADFRELYTKLISQPIEDIHNLIRGLDIQESLRWAAQDRFRIMVFDTLEQNFERLDGDEDVLYVKEVALKKAKAIAKAENQPACLVLENRNRDSAVVYILPNGRVGKKDMVTEYFQGESDRYMAEVEAFRARARVDRKKIVTLLRRLETISNYLARLVYSLARNGEVKDNGSVLIRKTQELRDVHGLIAKALYVEP